MSPALTDRARRRALAALSLLIALAFAAFLIAAPDPERPAPRRAPPRLSANAPAPPPRPRPSARLRGAQRGEGDFTAHAPRALHRHALATARRFLRALVVYETGRTEQAAAGLRSSATASLRAELLAHPPRRPSTKPPASARTAHVELLGIAPGLAEVQALLRSGRRQSVLVLQLIERHGRFYVAAMR